MVEARDGGIDFLQRTPHGRPPFASHGDESDAVTMQREAAWKKVCGAKRAEAKWRHETRGLIVAVSGAMTIYFTLYRADGGGPNIHAARVRGAHKPIAQAHLGTNEVCTSMVPPSMYDRAAMISTFSTHNDLIVDDDDELSLSLFHRCSASFKVATYFSNCGLGQERGCSLSGGSLAVTWRAKIRNRGIPRKWEEGWLVKTVHCIVSLYCITEYFTILMR